MPQPVGSSPTLAAALLSSILLLSAGGIDLEKKVHVHAATPPSHHSVKGTPCLMQNGCQCDPHNVTQVLGKLYGTCTSCYPLFSGPTCADRTVQCDNDGIEKPIGGCDCAPQYTGSKCTGRQCVNSVGGAGQFKTAGFNQSNMCGSCEDGNYGVSCSMCSSNSGCKNYGAGYRCINDTPVSNSSRKSFQCAVPPPFKGLLKGEESFVQMECHKDGGWRDRTTSSSSPYIANGTCGVALYRTEANYKWQDPFFQCSLYNCSMTVQTVTEVTPSNGYSKRLDGIWWIGTLATLILSAILVLNGSFVKSQRTKRNVLIAVYILLTMAVTTFIAGAAATMHYDSPNRNKVKETVVDYDCKYTNCSCSPDVKSPYMSCAKTIFGTGYIHVLKGATKLRCFMNSTNCSLSLGNFNIKSDCAPSECAPPLADETKHSSHNPFSGLISDDGSGNGGSSGFPHLASTGILVLFAFLGTIALVIHYFMAKKTSKAAGSEFVRRFGDLNAPGDGSNFMRTGDIGSESRNELVSSAGNVEEEVEPERKRNTSLSTTELRTPRTSIGLGGDDDEEADDDEHGEDAGLVSRKSGRSISPTAPADGKGNSDHSAYILKSGDSDGDNGMQRRLEEQAELDAAPPRESVLSISHLSYFVEADEDTAAPAQSGSKKKRSRLLGGRGGSNEGEESAATPAGENNNQNPAVSAAAKGKKLILNQVSFSVSSGEMCALMGPSGAGKTTLLDIISMRSKSGTVTGSMYLDEYKIGGGAPKKRNGTTDDGNVNDESSTSELSITTSQFKSLIGYVSQEDNLLASLTVYQAVTYAARFKLPAILSDETIHDVVVDTLNTLKLGHCINTIIGDERKRGLSGGEKRRVSIAMELVGRPKILFLDEPTSGLDSCSAQHVMEAISAVLKQSHAAATPGAAMLTGSSLRSKPLSDASKRLARCPYFNFKPIVVFSIHQPSAETYRLFDKIVLLAKGSILCFGPASTAVASLIQTSGYTGTPTVSNPADFLLRLEDQLSSTERSRLLDHSSQYEVQPHHAATNSVQRPPLMITSRFYLNGWQKLGLLWRRTLTTMLGSYYLISCHYLVTILLSIFMSALYRKEPLDLSGALNRAGSMSFLLLVVGFISISSTEIFLAERRVFLHERESGFYTSMPYYIPKLFMDMFTLRVTPIVILGAVIYFSMGFRTDDSGFFLWYLLVLTLFSVTVTAMIVCIAMITPSFGVAALFSSIVLLWQFVFGGLLVQSDTIPSYLKWTSKASPFFLAFEPLLVNELNGQHCTFAPRGADGQPTDTNIPIECVQYLANLGLTPKNFSTDVSLLAFWFIFYVVLGWALLSYAVKQRK